MPRLEIRDPQNVRYHCDSRNWSTIADWLADIVGLLRADWPSDIWRSTPLVMYASSLGGANSPGGQFRAHDWPTDQIYVSQPILIPVWDPAIALQSILDARLNIYQCLERDADEARQVEP